MFLSKIQKKNKPLVDTSIMLHQSGKIPANSYVLDIDVIKSNAAILAKEAKQYKLRTYYMTKQISRNPVAVKAALEAGIDSTVAVSAMGAKILHRHGLPVGHVGHLSQIPRNEINSVMTMKPELWTIYSLQMAQWISEAAIKQNCVQDILIKIAHPDNMFLPGQDSGIWVSQLKDALEEIRLLRGVRVVGVTAFPCVTYDVYGTEGTKATPNFKALEIAKEIIEGQGMCCDVINAPGNTSTDNLKLFSQHGGTHVEPGHGITGTTPAHIYEDLPEIPGMVYVSEVSHHFKDHAYAYGGGLYVCIAGGPKGYPVKVLIGDKETHEVKAKVHWDQVHRDNIDYYAMLKPGNECQVGGDTVVFGFRPQAFVTRAYTAAVSGISDGKPVVEGIFDCMGHSVEL